MDLSCTAVGNPVPSIKWKMDNVILKNSSHHFIKTIGHTPSPLQQSVLHISNISVHDQGLYSCIAQNPQGEIKYEAPLVVKNPSHTQKPQDHIYKVGTDAVIDCDVQGHLVTHISWIHKGK